MTDPRNRDDLLLDAAGRVLGGDPDNQTWRMQSPEHAAAFDRMQHSWIEMDGFRDQVDLQRLMGPEHPRARFIRLWRQLGEALSISGSRVGWAAAASLCLLLLAGVLMFKPWADPRPEFETATGEVRNIRLSDGSVVTLGPETQLQTSFSEGERRVRLTGGEAFFSVTKNPARPFVVLAGNAMVRVLGTKFNVNASSPIVRVSVLEGRVQVARVEKSLLARTVLPVALLTTGQEVVIEKQSSVSAAPATVVAAIAPGAWRSGRRSYDDVPLGEVIADANRYYAGKIEITDDATASTRITTSFRPGQVDQMLNTFSGTLGVKIEHQADGTILLSKTHPTSAL